MKTNLKTTYVPNKHFFVSKLLISISILSLFGISNVVYLPINTMAQTATENNINSSNSSSAASSSSSLDTNNLTRTQDAGAPSTSNSSSTSSSSSSATASTDNKATINSSNNQVNNAPTATITTKAMYRLYNPNNHEHLYTADFNEAKTLISIGWGNYEGVAWYAPDQGTPVYRLYNPILRDHHYTSDTNEVRVLTTKNSWKNEGIAWYSDDSKQVPVYRAFLKGLTSGSHNYTKDSHEQQVLTTQHDWINEGISWYGSNTVPSVNYDNDLKNTWKSIKGLEKVRFDKVATQSRSTWLHKTIETSISLSIQANIFPSVMVAQAILESAWGESGLSVYANNLFGIKKGTWTGAVYYIATGENATSNGEYMGYRTLEQANSGAAPQKLNLKKGDKYYIKTEFRKYNSQAESLANYVAVISQSGYNDVRKPQAQNYKQAANALSDNVGYQYATSPSYSQSIINVIETYNLQALD
ncbi:MAG: glucosaminidase domain-containing protein [Lactobacillaceae bacterium]|jgi:flagellum-specific peptidoglycan hydrolase FlgJ|nr:glucosaminidase domain-containing protein [Lactobacillaceae bacterium]